MEECFDSFDNDDMSDMAAMQYDSQGMPKGLAMLTALADALVKCNEACTTKEDAAANGESDIALAFRGGPAATRKVLKASLRELLEFAEIMQPYTPCCYVLACIYMDRLLTSREAKAGGLVLEPSTVHRLMAAAFVLAIKFADQRNHSDDWLPLHSFMEGIDPEELNDLEVRFLRAIDYRLYVTRREFRFFCEMLENLRACGKRKRREIKGAEEAEELPAHGMCCCLAGVVESSSCNTLLGICLVVICGFFHSLRLC